MSKLNDLDIAHWRMLNLRLTGEPFHAPEDVVRWLGAVQAQDYGPAKWSLASRTPAVRDAALDQAFDAGTVLRTHVLRPTWHFVLPADIRWMLDLTGPRVHAQNAYMYRRVELDAAALKTCTTVLVDALRGGNWLTRKQIEVVLEKAGIVADGFRLSYVMMHAELSGIVCSGALNGRQHTYALLDERVPESKPRTRDEALAELTRRYFTSHGPATVKDFRWWSSLTVADIRKGLDMVGPELDNEVSGGVSYWFAPRPALPAVDSPAVRLLQGYDEYLVGYSETKHVVTASRIGTTRATDRSVFNGVVILDSQVAGHWKRTLMKGSIRIEAALYEPFNHLQTSALEGEGERHGRFLGLSASVIQTQI